MSDTENAGAPTSSATDAPHQTSGSGHSAILDRAWDRFIQYDLNAGTHQTIFHRRQILILALGIVAVLLALSQAEYIGTEPPIPYELIDDTLAEIAGHEASLDGLAATEAEALQETIAQRRSDVRLSQWYRGLQYGIIIVPIFISILIAVSNKLKAGPKWILLRSAAESVKREIFSYRAAVGIYSPNHKDNKTRDTRLANQLKVISDRLMKSVVNEAGMAKPEYNKSEIAKIIDKHSPNDNGFEDISAEQYLEYRLQSQLDYFLSRTEKMGLHLKYLQWLVYIAGGVGTLLAALGFEIWVALTTALATAFITYLEYRQTENTLMAYNQVASDLDSIKDWWIALSPVEKRDLDNKTLLIEQCEGALASELSGWVRNMTDALAQIQERQERNKQEALTHEQLFAQVEALKAEADDKRTKTREMLSKLKTLIDADASENDNAP